MSEVTLTGIWKSYGSLTVIAGLDLTIRSGEFVALVGPSGSGKSTLLRIIAGLEAMERGTIRVDGRDMTRVDPSERDMAMVFQSYALYPHMTVSENMTFALRMRKIAEEVIEKRLKEALEMLGLGGLDNRKPGQLSGGQRQRVAMGRAIVRQPGVFLFDEPLSNLDAKLRANTRLELRALHDRLGATSIFVTHDQIEAMTMADRIVLLDQGIIQQIGTPREIYRAPANRFVAGFIGTPEINMLADRLDLDGDRLRFGGLHLPASADRIARLRERNATGRPIQLGIRPEHFRLRRDGGAQSLRLTVEAVEFTGQDVIVVGRAPQGRITLRADLRNDGAIAESVDRGTEVFADLVEDQWHVFDAETGLCQTAA